MATARSIRSNAAPASNRPHTKHQSSSRPELRVVSNPRGNEQGNVVGRDIEDDQAKLDQLVANLPDKASDMGMVPQQGSVSIDLSGYQSNKGGTQ